MLQLENQTITSDCCLHLHATKGFFFIVSYEIYSGICSAKIYKALPYITSPSPLRTLLLASQSSLCMCYQPWTLGLVTH